MLRPRHNPVNPSLRINSGHVSRTCVAWMSGWPTFVAPGGRCAWFDRQTLQLVIR